MPNMFKSTLASGTSSGIPLIVTCASAFAGLTITCTDGTTTLTDVCPSSSPYEITFNLPNIGTWTVSGTISGTTYTESVLVQDIFVELKNNINISVDFYSAANDTVSYTGLDNQTHTITTDSSGRASATITIPPTGTTITFTSSVAKDPDNLSNDYSKSIALTSATTDVYLMPDNTLYWWGYKKNNNIINTSTSVLTPTYNTNYISANMTTSSGSWIKAIDFNQPSISMSKQNLVGKSNVTSSKTSGSRFYSMSTNYADDVIVCTANTIFKNTSTYVASSSIYMYPHSNPNTGIDIYALWYE